MDQDGRLQRQVADEEVSVGVAGEQDRLEEHDCHRPYGRRPAQRGHDHLCEHGLDGEQQKGRQANGCGENWKGRRDRAESFRPQAC
jgi:hypothetical protein